MATDVVESSGAYSELHPGHIIETAERLEQRINERFPGAGLGRVAAELHRVAGETERITARLRRPIWPLRIGTVVSIALLVGFALWLGSLLLRVSLDVNNLSELLQGIDAALNEVIFCQTFLERPVLSVSISFTAESTTSSLKCCTINAATLLINDSMSLQQSR